MTFDWHELARLALASRIMDNLEEDELAPAGLVTYQFSAKGHELPQLLISQLLTEPFDAASVYYRSRPFMLGSGLTLEEAFACDMARVGSVSGGRDVGVVFNLPRRERALVLPMAGDVGSQYTPAAGWAQTIRYRVETLGEEEKDGSIAVVFGGDGSVATNGFWSALTMATTLGLPLLFVIEDNGYAISVTDDLQTPGGNIAANLASFGGLHIIQGSGTNPTETAGLVQKAVRRVREGGGPVMLRVTVPRLSGHSGADTQAYKSDEVLASEEARDPIPAIREYMLTEAGMTADEWESLETDVEREVRRASEAAQAQPQPNPAQVGHFAFAVPGEPSVAGGLTAEGVELPAGTDKPHADKPIRINMIDAIRRTLRSELGVNERLLIFGEDVGVKGGVHAATLDLQAEYGDDRVFDTSLSEEGIIGRAVGMALAGLMPVPEIQFRKYADPATEQINNCGTLRWRTNGQFAAPIVVRIPGGYRKIGDPWHSVTNEDFFAHAVGWRVAMPSNAQDAVGLLRSAMRGDDPVIFFEHRAMLDSAWARRPYPGDDFVLPFGRAAITMEGDKLTVVTWGAMVERVEAAAKRFEAGRVEVIDLRTVAPWDMDTVCESVKKTSRCLVVHEDIEYAGFGAEVAATVGAEVFLWLDAPVERLAAPAVPVPFNTTLMDAVVPTVERIYSRMDNLLAF